MAVPALPATGCTNTFSLPGACSSAETSREFNPNPPARQRLPPLPPAGSRRSSDGLLDAGRNVRAHGLRDRLAIVQAEPP